MQRLMAEGATKHDLAEYDIEQFGHSRIRWAAWYNSSTSTTCIFCGRRRASSANNAAVAAA